MSVDVQKFEQWAILEIMGHNRFAGRVSEETIAGAAFLRIDIPAIGDRAEFTKLFSPSSVYAITPVSETIARGVAEELAHVPIGVYDLPEWMRDRLKTKQLPLTLGVNEVSDDSGTSEDEDEPW